MLEELNTTIETLRNTRSGWATRKEAAMTLGQAARDAMAALAACREDNDRDVRDAVLKALALTDAAAAAEAGDAAYSLQDLLAPCVKSKRYEVHADGDGYRVKVDLGNDRTQTVLVFAFKRKDGEALLRIHTLCAEFKPDMAMWALDGNNKIQHCAFAVAAFDGKPYLTLGYTFRLNKATPETVKQTVKEAAFIGDWFENRFGKEDLL